MIFSIVSMSNAVIRRVLIRSLAAICFAFLSLACQAKIGDCPSIVSDDIEYSSHSNYLQATQKKTGIVLWKTILFTEIYKGEFDPKLEADVQWNIACIRELREKFIIASDSKGRVFHVQRTDGKLIVK